MLVNARDVTQGRVDATATRLPDGRMLVVGGTASRDGSVLSDPAAEIYDPDGGD